MPEELIHVHSTGSTGTHYVTQSWLDEQTAARKAEREAELVPIRAFADRLATYGPMDRISEMVLDLHSPDDRFECDGCGGYDPEWPCRTVLLIADDYGIELPSDG